MSDILLHQISVLASMEDAWRKGGAEKRDGEAELS